MDFKWVNTKKISCLFLLPPVFRACVYLYTKRELFALPFFLSGSMDAVLFGRQLLRHTYIDKVSVCVCVPASFRCSNGQPFVWIIDSILLQPVGRELHFPVPNNMRTRNGEPCQRYESYAATGPQFLYIYIPIWSSRSTQCDASARSILIRPSSQSWPPTSLSSFISSIAIPSNCFALSRLYLTWFTQQFFRRSKNEIEFFLIRSDRSTWFELDFFCFSCRFRFHSRWRRTR